MFAPEWNIYTVCVDDTYSYCFLSYSFCFCSEQLLVITVLSAIVIGSLDRYNEGLKVLLNATNQK